MNRTFHDTDTSKYKEIKDKDREDVLIPFGIGFVMGTILTILTIILMT